MPMPGPYYGPGYAPYYYHYGYPGYGYGKSMEQVKDRQRCSF